MPGPNFGEQLIREQITSQRYLQAIRARITQGRTFQIDGGGVEEILINKTLATRYFSGGNPLGSIVYRQVGNRRRPLQIVGVIDDLYYPGVNEGPVPEIYFWRGIYWRALVAVRTVGNPYLLIDDIRNIVRQMDSSIALDDVATMEERIFNKSFYARPRFYTIVLAIFAAVAAVLAIVGTYGVASCFAVERTKEVGIRMALGATRQRVIGLVLRDGLRGALIGVMLGMLGAVSITGSLKHMLFGIAALDLRTFLVVPACFVLVSAIACYVPAHRISRGDVIATLRYE